MCFEVVSFTWYRALFIEYRALFIEYRALFTEYRALLIACNGTRSSELTFKDTTHVYI